MKSKIGFVDTLLIIISPALAVMAFFLAIVLGLGTQRTLRG